jgi:hypothetical protein
MTLTAPAVTKQIDTWQKTAAVLSPLLRHTFGRRLGWQGDPGVARLLPHRDGWSGEIQVGKVADGNGDISRKAFALQ